jgi:hypothetical protein
MNITTFINMKKYTILLILSLSPMFAVNAFAGNGSGNPKNDSYSTIKPNPTPIMIWKDGHLVKNPEYFKSDSPYMQK